MSDYNKLEGINFSRLKNFDRSGIHFEHSLFEERDDTGPMRLGRAIHLATLQPAEFPEQVVAFDGRRYGREWDAFKKEHKGKEILSRSEYSTAAEIASVVLADPQSRDLVGNLNLIEHSMQWSDAETGVKCKGRFDGLTGDGLLIDLKSTKDASPEGFSRDAYHHRYYAQLAFYFDGLVSQGREVKGAALIAVESFAPYVVQVYHLPDWYLQMGREQYREWLRMYQDSITRGRFEGYAPGPLTLTLPRYAQREDDADVSEVGLTFG